MVKITKVQAQKALENLKTALKEADTLGYYCLEISTLQAVIDEMKSGDES